MSSKFSAENISIDRLKVQSLLALADKNLSTLARHLGVTPQHVHDMLRGRRNILPYERQIASFLGVSVQKIRVRKPKPVEVGAGTSKLTHDPQ